MVGLEEITMIFLYISDYNCITISLIIFTEMCVINIYIVHSKTCFNWEILASSQSGVML